MNLLENVEQVKERIIKAQQRSGSRNSIEIIAVTKTHPPETIEAVLKSGLNSIGENRIQEAENKFAKIPNMLPKFTKRLVGHLQSNKINKALQLFDTIDSVDSVKLAQKIGNRAVLESRVLPVLLEVNTSGETAKFGFEPENIDSLLACFDIEGIEIQGLMTVGPLTDDTKVIRRAFQALRGLLDKINSQVQDEKAISELSMGMSNDFEIAVEEGATMVRLGTALFGPRSTLR